jgi:hypothetical protein
LHVLHDEPSFGIAGRRNLVVALWRDAPQVAWFQAIRDTTWPYADRWPEGAGWINLILSGTPRFSEEVRREAAAISTRDDIYRQGTAHVVTLEGLRGSATRAFLSTIFLLARSRTPTRVFADVAAAADWIAPKLGPGWTVAEVEEFCHACEMRLGH